MIKITITPANRLCKGAHSHGPSHYKHYRHSGLLSQRAKFLLDLFSVMEAKSAYVPIGPSGRSLSRFLYHEVTRNISTPPPGWVTPSIKFAGTHFYTWVERGTVRVVFCPSTQHNDPGQGSNSDCSIRG